MIKRAKFKARIQKAAPARIGAFEVISEADVKCRAAG
jgi:hypothetical protein